MTNTSKGFVRGVVYPILAFVIHFGLATLLKSGWLSDAGALAMTGFIAYIDHTVLPNINM